MANPRNPRLLANARQLRKEMTPEERHLWYDFLRHCRPRFRRQEIIGNYIADFYCDLARLVIEVDGSQHMESEGLAYDAKRTAYFESLGIQVVRYYNTDIKENFDGVCSDIFQNLWNRGFRGSMQISDSQ